MDKDQAIVELSDDDSIRDVLEEAFPDMSLCPYPGCTTQVSVYKIQVRCRYCKGFYCQEHADYHIHGCGFTL